MIRATINGISFRESQHEGNKVTYADIRLRLENGGLGRFSKPYNLESPKSHINKLLKKLYITDIKELKGKEVIIENYPVDKHGYVPVDLDSIQEYEEFIKQSYLKEFLLENSPTLSDIDRILKLEYKGEPIPQNTEIIIGKSKGGYIKRPKPLSYIRVAHLDFENFYPNIIKDYELSPKSDTKKAFLKVVNRALNLKKELGDNKNLKRFLVILSSGYLGCEHSTFRDKDLHRTILSRGRKIIRSAINHAKGFTYLDNRFFLILAHTDGFFCWFEGKKDFSKISRELERYINNFLGNRYNHLRIKLKGVYTDTQFFNVNSYILRNSYTKEVIVKGSKAEKYLRTTPN